MNEETDELTMLLPGVPTSPRRARRFVGDALVTWSLEELLEAVELLACELVTNAVLHVHGDIVLRVRKLDTAVRVEVVDTSPVPPRSTPVVNDDVEGATGRGLMLVDALAAAWGVESAREGKKVWFEVAA